jgi:hypothetical protein
VCRLMVSRGARRRGNATDRGSRGHRHHESVRGARRAAEGIVKGPRRRRVPLDDRTLFLQVIRVRVARPSEDLMRS